MVTNVVAILLTLWGMIGIWTTKFGWVVLLPISSQDATITHVCLVRERYHNKWEFWVHKALYGLFQAPYYSYSQTVMAELSPPGFDFLVRAKSPPPLLKNKNHAIRTLTAVSPPGTLVFRPVWIDGSRVFDTRALRDPGDHRQDGQHLARVLVPVCDYRRVEFDLLVGCRHAQRQAGCRAMGARAAWSSI